MKPMQRIAQAAIIVRILEAMEMEEGLIKNLTLSAIEDKGRGAVMRGRITDEFFHNVFGPGSGIDHYEKVNAEFIKNYIF